MDIKINKEFRDYSETIYFGLNMRQLSRVSGVPYTIINELVNRKKDINQRSAETIFRIANALHTDSESLLNPIHVMDRFYGSYLGISYHWTYNRESQGMLLSFRENGTEHTVQTKYQFLHFNDKAVYIAMSEMIIQSFLDQKHSGIEMEQLAARLKGGIADV